MSRQPPPHGGPPNGYRNASNGSTPSFSQANGPPTATSSQNRIASMSRAERFEDEKRRIIESCFSKLDQSGQLAESYITHIRIQEDGQYPSTPPPPDSSQETKKPRLIIIAVRSTGRVRMHKARENNNGSFSIGKTWNLEELSAIESFSSSAEPPESEKEAQHRAWAGNVGFTVTITKPYYWQAGTPKEKEFFIVSAVKIYRKYTKGQIPELRGFDESQKVQLLGAPPPGQQQPQPPPPQGPPPLGTRPREASDSPQPPQPPFAQRPQSRERSRYRGSPGPPPSMSDNGQAGSGSESRHESPAPYAPPPPIGVPKPFASSEHLRAQSREGARQFHRPGTSPGPGGDGRLPPPNAVPMPRAPSAQSSNSQLRPESPANLSVTSSREAMPSSQLGPTSPGRKPSYQQSMNSLTEDESLSRSQAPPPPTNGTNGASLFQATRERWAGQQQQQQPQQQRPPLPQQASSAYRAPSPQRAPRIPAPIDTQKSNAGRHQQAQPSVDRVPKSAESELSSPGLDADFAAAFASVPDFMGPEHAVATPPPPKSSPPPPPQAKPTTEQHPRKQPPKLPARQQEQPEPTVQQRPPSPQPPIQQPQFISPGRSRKRIPSIGFPQLDLNSDLRPAPLAQRNVSSSTQQQRTETPEGPSRYATPKETTETDEPAPTPVMPLSPTKNNSATDLHIPGAFEEKTAVGPSPLAAPAIAAETPPPATHERTVSDESITAVEAEEEQHRPGLGPMIKKKGVAERFKRAATAASAFKPRPGGAAEKILQAKAQREATGAVEPDGITGVVPRPVAQKQEKEKEQEKPVQQEPPVDDVVPAKLAAEESVKDSVAQPPKVEVSSPLSPARVLSVSEQTLGGMDGTNGIGIQLEDSPRRLSTPDDQTREEEEERERVEQREVRQPLVKVKRRSALQEQYLSELGIDRSLLADKCLDFEMMLHDYGWNDAQLSPKALTEMEASLRREQSRLETGSWLSSSASQETNLREEREKQVLSLLDRAIQECDEMDGLLTIYNVELSSLNDDISYIEAQSQGLQVQAANQRTLHTELQDLVDTLSLDRSVFEPLRQAELADARGLDNAEQSLVRLYEALVKIDPSIRSTTTSGRPKSRGGLGGEGSEVAGMAAVRQKRDAYVSESDRFCKRVIQHLDSSFSSAFSGVKGKMLLPVSATNASGMMKLNGEAFNEARRELWIYSPLVLFTKELNQPAWDTLLRMYHSRVKPTYADAFGQNVAYWKRCLRKPTGEEAELLFTAQEKDDAANSSGALSSARKLTVKRSQTLARTLRSASGEKPGSNSGDARNTGSMTHSEVFSGAVDEMAVLLSFEQNFVVDFFHASSLEIADFTDVVSKTPPYERYGTNLAQQKPLDPDRDMARLVTGVMNEIFGFFTNELSSLVDWCIVSDPIQGVGVMACLNRHAFFLQDTSQEFLVQLVETLKGRLTNMFAKFVDEQVRAIEDTKVKIKKRKGVIGFMKIFPHFAMAVENTFASVGREDYERNADSMAETRLRVDEAYDRINRAMFDSLKVIAKESPGTTAPQRNAATDDPEDKEMLNYHVLIIENMNHYIAEVDDSGRQSVLTDWKGRAETERREAMDAYVGQVIRRPLGKLLEFLDSIDSMQASHPQSPASVTSRPTYSRKAARNLLSQHDSKELRRGIDQLRTRIEKHFGHGDDEVKARQLVTLVCKECERAYERTYGRIDDMIRDLYPNAEGEKAVECGFSKTDVQTSFGR
ncbi:hypothetical protein LTR37_009624 [Vermiconidia calcicola]|uniref:Uncharacterized protein n=1 Tax=Vermiconidia calcicola TaxID=1690605 RepID=A0ACC3N7I0_9PEZI|nr:hypothetical protein LTR37_009624 [Vermiconidia calcicola]